MPPHLTPLGRGFMTPFPRTAANYTIDSRLRKKLMKPLKCPCLLPPPPLHQQFVNFLGWFLVSMDTAASLLWKEAS